MSDILTSERGNKKNTSDITKKQTKTKKENKNKKANKEERNDITISFVGYDDTLYGNLCQSYVRENGLEQNVEFIGEVISVEPYLQEADLMIHVSKCESYPGVLVEAMANGVPVMIKAVAGIPELIKDGENGYLIYDDSIEGLYSVFLRVLDDWKEDGLETVISKEYETFLVNHTFSTVQSSLEDYYSGSVFILIQIRKAIQA